MRTYRLIPLVPAVGLVSMPFLPFLDAPDLWFGLPRMVVWGAAWCLLCTPALLLTGRLMGRDHR
jgi:hypothetical protein